jgi:hypothetical protein
MSDRHQILSDEKFWLALEYKLSGWFRTSGNRSLGGLWCDGFLPHSASDTKNGIDVHGDAWIGDGRREQQKYSFVVSIPQRMVGRRRSDVALTDIDIDVEQERLRFAVEPAASSEQ